ncbi:MAG: PEP-CTERM sorting domain-containing protein, partial [Acidobacteriota bacterium]|nr:PEP-CTERM sorting domain-containing protein [Acidobacteriota bacterium]
SLPLLMDSVLDAQVVTGDTFSSTYASASLSILDGGGAQLFSQSEQCFSTASCTDASYHGSGVSLSIAPNTPYEVILNVGGTTSDNNSSIHAYADPHFSLDSAFSGADSYSLVLSGGISNGGGTPEPSSALLLCGGLLAALAAKRGIPFLRPRSRAR